MPRLNLPNMNIPQYTHTISPELRTLFASYAGCVFFHYIVANMYPPLCTPVTWSGLIMSPFYAPMPHCRALAWAIYHGNNAIGHMWLMFGGWLMLVVGQKMMIRSNPVI